MPHVYPRRRATLALAATFLAAALAVLGASPAWAHDELIGSNPADGATVEVAPKQIVLTFSGVLLSAPGSAEVHVTDSAKSSLVAGDPVIDGTTLTQPIQGGAAGTITVVWKVVSSDGHPISQEFSFTAQKESSDSPPDVIAPIAPAPGQPVDTSAIWIAGGAVTVAAIALIFLLRARRHTPRED